MKTEIQLRTGGQSLPYASVVMDDDSDAVVLVAVGLSGLVAATLDAFALAELLCALHRAADFLGVDVERLVAE